MKLPLENTALVVVDVWDIHHIESYCQRMEKALEGALLPALEACRQRGVTIIHAPSPEIAYQRFADRLPGPQASDNQSAPRIEWPPDDFRKREGKYHDLRGPREQEPGVMAKYTRTWDLSPRIDVREGEFVVADGTQLDHVCQQNGILHLLYCGFLANWCVLSRDYGIRNKARQGYNVILLRDATAGTEYPDTLDSLLATENAIREVEQQYGFSTCNRNLLSACFESDSI